MYLETQSNDCAIDDSVSVKPTNPLKKIALMFSGGGFRAASFSLGALSYLHRIQYKDNSVLENVRFITSTSGGSITNAAYAVKIYSDQEFDFKSFYQNLRNNMDGESMLKDVFDILRDSSKWPEDGELSEGNEVKKKVAKSRNLINSFAKAYEKSMYGSATLSDISDSDIAKTQMPHLHEVCFNSTEFNNGMNFYFQVSGLEHKVRSRGNGYLKFRDFVTAKKLKISDIVAASSCFPSGFEPIIYPNDFVHAGCSNVNEMLDAIEYQHNNPIQLEKVINKPFSLMDGGIADNMGIHSVLIKDSECTSDDKFDLILSCDVTSYFNDPLSDGGVPYKGPFSNLSIETVINWFKISILVLIVSLALILTNTLPVIGYLLLIPSAVMSLIYIISSVKFHKAKKSSSGITGIAMRYLGYFFKLPFSSLIPLLRQRINSSLKLVTDMFLKQIRRGQYDHMFSQPLMKDRAISCLIYEFSNAHEQRRLKNLTERDNQWWPGMSSILMPGDKIQSIANEAKSMGTTLWFDDTEEDKKDKIIATGQFTTCYSLIKHICRLETLEGKYTSDVNLQDLKQRLLEDWRRFKENPLFMIDNLKAH